MLRLVPLVLVLIGFSFTGCNKDKDHTSLLGAWNCEEIPEKSVSSIYQVNIVRNNLLPDENNQYVIYNFNQLGLEEDRAVYFRQDSTGELVITGTEIIGIYIEGSGIVASDFSKIDWNYMINKEVGNEHFIATYY